MDKVFSNKKFAFALIGILLALQLTQSIANWCGGGFNGGSLVLCILMLGLLTLIGVGIAKQNKLLTIISGVSVLSVVIYVWISQYSGMIQQCVDGKVPFIGLIPPIFSSLGILLLIGIFVLIILKAFKVNKNLKTINTIFSIIAAIMFLGTLIIGFSTGLSSYISDPQFTVCEKIYSIVRDFGAIFFTLLIPCVWHQVDTNK